MQPERVLLTILLSYLMGSFPTAYLVGRLNGINIFESGSGNMGTANATRVMGFKWGLVVWAGDILKAVVAILIARALLAPSLGWANVLGAVFAVIGHNWSIIATVLTGRVRGGKGAATWWGAFMMMAPAPAIAVVALLFAGIVALTRYISLGVLASVAAGAASLAVLVALGQGLTVGPAETINIYLVYAVVAGVVVFYRHRENIQRLLAGTERRFGERA